jgi:hypothetical protein
MMTIKANFKFQVNILLGLQQKQVNSQELTIESILENCHHNSIFEWEMM